MATEIKVPTLGESVTTATIARWIKHPGDTVAADDPLVELETDKVTVEVAAPAAGVLTAINFPEGAEVEVGALLGMLDGEAASRRLAPARRSRGRRRSAPSGGPRQTRQRGLTRRRGRWARSHVRPARSGRRRSLTTAPAMLRCAAGGDSRRGATPHRRSIGP